MIILEKQIIFLSADVLCEDFCSVWGDLQELVRKALEVNLGSIGLSWMMVCQYTDSVLLCASFGGTCDCFY